VSNIRPAGHNLARQAFLSGPQGLPEMSKMIDFVSIRFVFSSYFARRQYDSFEVRWQITSKVYLHFFVADGVDFVALKTHVVLEMTALCFKVSKLVIF